MHILEHHSGRPNAKCFTVKIETQLWRKAPLAINKSRLYETPFAYTVCLQPAALLLQPVFAGPSLPSLSLATGKWEGRGRKGPRCWGHVTDLNHLHGLYRSTKLDSLPSQLLHQLFPVPQLYEKPELHRRGNTKASQCSASATSGAWTQEEPAEQKTLGVRGAQVHIRSPLPGPTNTSILGLLVSWHSPSLSI